jgi:hypothetical protein
MFDNKTAGPMVFAANTHSRFYHLVEVEMRTAKTLCGLKVAMIIEPEPSSAALHLVSVKPPEYVVCIHCVRLTETETPITANPMRASDQTSNEIYF